MTSISEHIQEFLDYLNYQRNYSDHTIKNYQRDLELFCMFSNNSSDDLRLVNKRICRQFLYHLEQKKSYHPKSLSRIISACRSFWAYLIKEDHTNLNPWLQIKLPKVPKRLPKIVSSADMKSFLDDMPYDSPVNCRDRLICEILYGSGMRVSELCSLQIKDIDLKKEECKIIGKGKKERIALLSPIACQLIHLYLTTVRHLWAKEPNDFLLINQTGGPLSTRSVQRILKYRCDLHGKELSITPHDLRHSFASDLYNGGADLSVIKELLGHQHINSTQIYTHVSNESLEKAIKNAHPSES